MREAVPGNYGLVVNTGEFGPLEARAMIASGIDVVYHSLRLGEGRTTCFRPEERKATLSAVRDSDLKLAHLVEPVGPEHTDDEIADVLMTALSNGAALSGAMARINVKGTPFESHAPLPDLRLAQIVAITRICGGVNVPDICVHPPARRRLSGARTSWSWKPAPCLGMTPSAPPSGRASPLPMPSSFSGVPGTW